MCNGGKESPKSPRSKDATEANADRKSSKERGHSRRMAARRTGKMPGKSRNGREDLPKHSTPA